MRHRELKRALRDAGAVLVRQNKHQVYRFPSGQIYVLPTSPSDSDSDRIQWRRLRRIVGGQ